MCGWGRKPAGWDNNVNFITGFMITAYVCLGVGGVAMWVGQEANFKVGLVTKICDKACLAKSEFEMAETTTLKKLEEQLNCSICLDTYTNPKALQCLHVFCQQCLVSLSVHQRLTCPTCRQVTPVPVGGVAGLPTSFHINNLFNIFQDMVEKDIQSRIPRCTKHTEHELNVYCKTCGELICWRCCDRGEEHQRHVYHALSTAIKKYKEEMELSLKPLKKQVDIAERSLAELRMCRGTISCQQAAVVSDIKATFRILRNDLSLREAKLIDKVQEITNNKVEGLAAQRDQIRATLDDLKTQIQFIEENLKAGYKNDVLEMESHSKQVEELTTPFQSDLLRPSTGADLEFTGSKNYDLSNLTLFRVLSRDLPAPSKCYVTGKGKEVAFVREKAIAVLRIINCRSKPCVDWIKTLECILISEVTGTRTKCSAERRGQNLYEISYRPTIKGRHQLHVKVDGQHVRQSPFSVSVKTPVEMLGNPILTIDGVSKPWGVAINQRGELLVTEGNKHCVSVFSPAGVKLRSFGTQGSDQGQFQTPRGIAVDSEGNILVVDHDNHRIQKFTAEGKFLKAVGSHGDKPLQFSSPISITFATGSKKIYVSDLDNCRIQVLNSDLTFSGTFETGSSKKPLCTACNKDGRVYVVYDTDHPFIEVFTADGRFLRTFQRRSSGKNRLVYCIAIDTSGRVYIAEGPNYAISVLTTAGQLMKSFGKRGVGLGEFHCPRGLAVDSSGVVYVCDYRNDRIQMF